MPGKNLVLRTMYIDPDVDDELRTEAFDSRTSKNDLLRKYLRLGMEAAKKGGTQHKVPVKELASQRGTAVAHATVAARKVADKTGIGKTVTGVAAQAKRASKVAASR